MFNSRNIKELHPTLIRGCNELRRRMADQGYTAFGISSTFRDVAYQNHLFASGRSRPGRIITNARGGQSVHNYRLAFDIFQNIRGREWEVPFFEKAGNIWVKMGGVWGGNWVNFVDRPHFEFTDRISINQLQNGHTLSNNAIMKWEEDDEFTSKQKEDKMRFNNLNEIPIWGTATIRKLLATGVIRSDHNALDISLDMLRIFVIHDRLGLYN